MGSCTGGNLCSRGAGEALLTPHQVREALHRVDGGRTLARDCGELQCGVTARFRQLRHRGMKSIMAQEKMSPAKELASRVVFAALQILKEKGGQAPGREVVAEVEKRVQLDDWAKAVSTKTGTSAGRQCSIFSASSA